MEVFKDFKKSELSMGSSNFSIEEKMALRVGDGVGGCQDGLGCRKGEAGLRDGFLKNNFKR